MSQSIVLALGQAVTGPGQWQSLSPELRNRGFVVALSGANAAASVDIEVSNDGGRTFATRMSFSGVINSASDIDSNQPFPSIRHNVRSLSAGATVTTTVTATEGQAV